MLYYIQHLFDLFKSSYNYVVRIGDALRECIITWLESWRGRRMVPVSETQLQVLCEENAQLQNLAQEDPHQAEWYEQNYDLYYTRVHWTTLNNHT